MNSSGSIVQKLCNMQDKIAATSGTDEDKIGFENPQEEVIFSNRKLVICNPNIENDRPKINGLCQYLKKEYDIDLSTADCTKGNVLKAIGNYMMQVLDDPKPVLDTNKKSPEKEIASKMDPIERVRQSIKEQKVWQQDAVQKVKEKEQQVGQAEKQLSKLNEQFEQLERNLALIEERISQKRLEVQGQEQAAIQNGKAGANDTASSLAVRNPSYNQRFEQLRQEIQKKSNELSELQQNESTINKSLQSAEQKRQETGKRLEQAKVNRNKQVKLVVDQQKKAVADKEQQLQNVRSDLDRLTRQASSDQVNKQILERKAAITTLEQQLQSVQQEIEQARDARSRANKERKQILENHQRLIPTQRQEIKGLEEQCQQQVTRLKQYAKTDEQKLILHNIIDAQNNYQTIQLEKHRVKFILKSLQAEIREVKERLDKLGKANTKVPDSQQLSDNGHEFVKKTYQDYKNEVRRVVLETPPKDGMKIIQTIKNIDQKLKQKAGDKFQTKLNEYTVCLMGKGAQFEKLKPVQQDKIRQLAKEKESVPTDVIFTQMEEELLTEIKRDKIFDHRLVQSCRLSIRVALRLEFCNIAFQSDPSQPSANANNANMYDQCTVNNIDDNVVIVPALLSTEPKGQLLCKGLLCKP